MPSKSYRTRQFFTLFVSLLSIAVGTSNRRAYTYSSEGTLSGGRHLDPVAANIEFNKTNLLRRTDCSNPCGYYDQLCCDSNEVCYTDPSNEAQCSKTGIESEATQTITTIRASSITVETTAVDTTIQTSSIIVESTDVDTTIQTSSIIVETTAVDTLVTTVVQTAFPVTTTSETSAQNRTSTLATPTTVVNQTTHSLPATGTNLQTSVVSSSQTTSAGVTAVSSQPSDPSTSSSTGGVPRITKKSGPAGWPTWEKAVVGVIAGLAGMACIGWLSFWCWKRKRDADRARQSREAFDLTADGPHNTARQEPPSFSVRNESTATQDFLPRAPRRRASDSSGYDIVPGQPGGLWPDETVQIPPAYRTSPVYPSRSSTPRQRPNPSAGVGSSRARGVPPRRSVPYMSPTAELPDTQD